MRGEQDGQIGRTAAGYRVFLGATLALLLAGCGTSVLSGSSLNIFDSKKATTGPVAAGSDAAAAESTDIDCPDVTVRAGAATLMIGSKPSPGEPSALELRYQGSIVRTARECHVNAGVMTMKVGVEGRIITGPAGGPGTIDVPLRVAIVQEGVSPKAIVSKLAHIPVTITGEVDRASFTHVESDLTFPMPTPAGLIDSYVVYVGFDTMAEPVKKQPARRKPAAKKPG